MDFLEKQNKAGLVGRMVTNCIIQDTQEFNNLSSLVQMNSEEDKNHPDKKIRRKILNLKERRRIFSINTSLQRLKALVPSISNEKVSKV